MIAPDSAPLSLKNLRNTSPRTLTEALQAAKRLISKRTGLISSVEFDDLTADEPSVYFARSTPANSLALNGMETLNFGDATSIDPKRAIMKAVGETIERYCPSHFRYEDLLLSRYDELDCEAIDPSDFALFSTKQYAQPSFPFSPLTATTSLRWESAYSISQDRPVMIPASFVYIPYKFDPLHEPLTHTPISTGLACGSNLASAIYKAILEVIERDAFMIMWQNQLPCSRIDLSTITDPFNRSILNELEKLPVECQVYLVPFDIEVPVILVLLRSNSGHLPLTVMSLSADFDPQKAIMLALEEICLSWLGMGRYAQTKENYKPEKDYKDVNSLTLHGLAHAVDPDLGKSLEFLNSSDQQISVQDINNRYDANMVSNIRNLVNDLNKKNLNVIARDLTTVDINDAGFKVVRVVVPGMHPLDINHAHRYLGGTRLYEVPVQMGLRSRALTEKEVNPYPHMFP